MSTILYIKERRFIEITHYTRPVCFLHSAEMLGATDIQFDFQFRSTSSALYTADYNDTQNYQPKRSNHST
jgi:hypothetical protein